MFRANILEGSTIKILDEYIKSKEQYFLVLNGFNIIYNDKVYNIFWIISNKIKIGKQIIKTNITMTEFKKIYNNQFNIQDTMLNYKKYNSNIDRTNVPKLSLPVIDFLDVFFDNFEQYIDGTKSDTFFFDNPISINAQSSNNRSGYGNEYYYGTLIYEGTKYGETSEFPIVGYKVSLVGKITKDHQYWSFETEDGMVGQQHLPESVVAYLNKK